MLQTPDDASPLMRAIEVRHKETDLGYVLESEVDAWAEAHPAHVDADGYAVSYRVVIDEVTSTWSRDAGNAG